MAVPGLPARGCSRARLRRIGIRTLRRVLSAMSSADGARAAGVAHEALRVGRLSRRGRAPFRPHQGRQRRPDRERARDNLSGAARLRIGRYRNAVRAGLPLRGADGRPRDDRRASAQGPSSVRRHRRALVRVQDSRLARRPRAHSRTMAGELSLWWLVPVLAVQCLRSGWRRLLAYLRYFQQEGYEPLRFLRWSGVRSLTDPAFWLSIARGLDGAVSAAAGPSSSFVAGTCLLAAGQPDPETLGQDHPQDDLAGAACGRGIRSLGADALAGLVRRRASAGLPGDLRRVGAGATRPCRWC